MVRMSDTQVLRTCVSQRLLCVPWMAVIAVVVAGLMFILPSVRRAVDVSVRRHGKGQSLTVSLPGGVFRRKRAVHCFIAFLVASLCNCCCMMPFFHAARGNVRGCPTRTTSAVRVWLACLAHGARHDSLRLVSSSASRHRRCRRCRCRCRVRRCRSRFGTGFFASKSCGVRSWRWRAGLGGGAGARSARTSRPHHICAAMHSGSLSVVVLSLSVTAEVSIEPQ